MTEKHGYIERHGVHAYGKANNSNVSCSKYSKRSKKVAKRVLAENCRTTADVVSHSSQTLLVLHYSCESWSARLAIVFCTAKATT